MVLILSDSISDPKTTHMLRCLREKNSKYNSLSRLDEIIVTYKNELLQEAKQEASAPQNASYTKQYPRKKNTR
jgi:hypothetical protein